MTKLTLNVLVVVVLMLCCATPQTLAQDATTYRGSGGLFGATSSDAVDGNRLRFTFAAAEAFDSELPLQSPFTQAAPLSSGYSTILMGHANYAHTRGRTQVAGTAHTSFRYYQQLDSMDPVSHSAAIGANVKLPATSSIHLNQSAAYSPSYVYQLFPSAEAVLGEAIPAPPDYRVLRGDSYEYRTEIGWSMGRPRGIRFNASGTHDRVHFENQPSSIPAFSHSVGRAEISHGVRRNVGLSAGYEYRTGTFNTGTASTEHRLEFGATYSRALSVSRRAKFGFTLAPSTIAIAGGPQDALVPTQLHRLDGSGSVEYELRRTWRISGYVRRSGEYLPLVGAPIISDSGRVSTAGLLTERLDLMATAAYITGTSVLSRDSWLDSYTANARLRFALSRYLAIYGEYLYFYYELRGQHWLSAGLPNTLRQHGVRAGLTLWQSAF